MEHLATFFQNYGLAVTLIAIAGIAMLGIMKYCNLFKKIAEAKRHYIYLAISVGFSIVATAVYLLVVNQFEFAFLLVVASAIYALNQTFYNIFKVTPVNRIFEKVLDYIAAFLKSAGNRNN